MTKPVLSAQTRLLVVAPHPDDETLGAGVLIQQVMNAGGAVKLLLLTNGDNNPWPQRYLERRWRIDGRARARWGARRRAEVLDAIARLGLSESNLTAFDWPDMGLTDRLVQHTHASLVAMGRVLDDFSPTIALFPALEDRHPDHGAAHVLCRLALAAHPSQPDMLTFPIHVGAAATDYPLHADGSAAQQITKQTALSAYHSQMALSGGRMRRMAQGVERYRLLPMPHVAQSTDSSRRLPWQPPAALRPWLRILLATPNSVVDMPWTQAPIERDAQGVYRLKTTSSSAPFQPGFVKLHLDWPSPWIFDRWGWFAI